MTELGKNTNDVRDDSRPCKQLTDLPPLPLCRSSSLNNVIGVSRYHDSNVHDIIRYQYQGRLAPSPSPVPNPETPMIPMNCPLRSEPSTSPKSSPAPTLNVLTLGGHSSHLPIPFRASRAG